MLISINSENQKVFKISNFEGFGKKSVSNLLNSVEKSRHTDGRHLLYALNIPLCGGDVAKKLIERYPLEELIDIAQNSTSLFGDDFADIDGIGPEKVLSSSTGSMMQTIELM